MVCSFLSLFFHHDEQSLGATPPGENNPLVLGQGSGCCVPSLPSCQSSFVGSASRGRDGPWHTTSTHHLVPGVFIWAQVRERSQCRACPVPCRMGQHPPGSRLLLAFLRIRHKSTTGDPWADLEELLSMQALPPPPPVWQGSGFGLQTSMPGCRCSKDSSAWSLPGAVCLLQPRLPGATRGKDAGACLTVPAACRSCLQFPAGCRQPCPSSVHSTHAKM